MIWNFLSIPGSLRNIYLRGRMLNLQHRCPLPQRMIHLLLIQTLNHFLSGFLLLEESAPVLSTHKLHSLLVMHGSIIFLDYVLP